VALFGWATCSPSAPLNLRDGDGKKKPWKAVKTSRCFQKDADLAVWRTVYRKYAEQNGVGKLRRDNLQTALKMVKLGW